MYTASGSAPSQFKDYTELSSSVKTQIEKSPSAAKMKAECLVEKLNTEGKNYKLLNFPHLNLNLTVGEVYSMGVLVKRCHGTGDTITALRKRLQDRTVFQLVSD